MVYFIWKEKMKEEVKKKNMNPVLQAGLLLWEHSFQGKVGQAGGIAYEGSSTLTVEAHDALLHLVEIGVQEAATILALV